MSRHRSTPGAWAVLLAGGDGTRLQSLTTWIEGDERPKQFSRVFGNESLFRQSRRRISSLFDENRTIAVVTKKHESFFGPELSDLPKTSLIVQTDNRGTGIAIGATILMLLELDPNAVVAFFPCDHHYHDETAFLDAVEMGIRAAHENADKIVLLGAEPTHAETDYGWIEPTRIVTDDLDLDPVPVRRFWEKPALAIAQELLGRGCLWNTFVTVGRASTFLDMLWAAAPKAMIKLSAELLQSDSTPSYRSVPVIDFSHDVLVPQMERLLVIRDATSGWTDLGSPSRVLDTLTREHIAPSWLESSREVDLFVAGLGQPLQASSRS